MRTAAIFLLLASCAAHTEPRTSISLAVDDAAIVPSVEAAAAEWRQCGLEVTVHVGPATGDDFTVEYWESLPSNEIGEAAGHSIRYVSHTTAPVVFAHELGHAFGLGHAPHGVMTPAINPSAKVGDLECEAIRGRQ